MVRSIDLVSQTCIELWGLFLLLSRSLPLSLSLRVYPSIHLVLATTNKANCGLTQVGAAEGSCCHLLGWSFRKINNVVRDWSSGQLYPPGGCKLQRSKWKNEWGRKKKRNFLGYTMKCRRYLNSCKSCLLTEYWWSLPDARWIKKCKMCMLWFFFFFKISWSYLMRLRWLEKSWQVVTNKPTAS